MCGVLAPFYASTVTLSGHSYINISVVLKLWKRMTVALDHLKEKNDFALCTELCERLIESMERYFEKHLDLMEYKMSAALDPNSKRLKFIDKADRESVWKAILDECVVVSAEVQKRNDGTCDDSKQGKLPSSSLGKAKEISHSFGSTVLAELSESSSDDGDSRASDENLKAEIKSYREFSVKNECNPMDFWRNHHKLFPNLSKLARTYLGINASFAASERIFSSCGLITSGKRNQISRKLLCAIVLLNEVSKRPDLWKKLCKMS